MNSIANPIADIPGLPALTAASGGGAEDIRIAVIDGPVDPSHPVFTGGSGGARARLAVLSEDTDSARSAHGTHVASVIAGQPGSPVAGIAPRCTLLAIPVYREDAEGNLASCAQTTLARAIRHALDSGATLINISGGQFTPTGQADRFLEAEVQECARRNVLIVAAAGNDGCRCLHVPAALPTVLAVGACDRDGRPLPFSNHGDAYRENGILAPGADIPGAGPGGSVAARSGTSFATPIVTAVAALLLSLDRQRGGTLDPQAVRRILLDTATLLDASSTPGQGHGPARRLNVLAAMAAVPLHPPLSHHQHIGEATPMSATHQSAGTAPATILGPDGAPLSGVRPASDLSPGSGPQAAASAPAAAAAPAAAPAPVPAPAAEAALPAVPQGYAPAIVTPQAYVQQAFAPQQTVPQYVVPAYAAAPVGMPQAMSDHAAAPPPAAVASSASCGCGGLRPAAGIAPSQAVGESPVFVIGRLYYDFESEARFDYFVQAIAEWRKQVDPSHYSPGGDYAAPWNPEIMIKFLLYKDPETKELVNIPDSNALIWTLNIDTAPIYAIKPQSSFGFPMYLELLHLLWQQETSEPFSGVDSVKRIGVGPEDATATEKKAPPVQRVSQAGFIDGEVRLMNGTVVPQLLPVWRGMYGWNTSDIAGPNPPENFKEFLERIYNQFRNVGVSPQDRAMNYSAFNAFNTKKIFKEMAEKKMFLDTVSVDRSTICRPDSDCWDTTWTFFDPTATLTTARKVYQYTIDVSDVVPVSVGPLRDWMIF